MSGAGVLVEILNGYGVEHIFCSPGSEWPPFWEELALRAANGERTPGFNPGGQWIRYLADRGGPARFAEPCVKWSFGVNSRAVLASSIHRACQIAMAPPCGLVFLSLPFEFLFEGVAGTIPRSYLFGAESGGLGLGMGMALGLKCASPEKPVVALIGDGSFNYNPVLAALGFSQEYGRPMVTIVMNNAGYLSMKRGITALYPEGWAARTNNFPGWAISPNPRYAELAKAFDACGETIEDPADIEPALRRAFEAERSGRSTLIDVRLAPDA